MSPASRLLQRRDIDRLAGAGKTFSIVIVAAGLPLLERAL
jgi:hypothetical protein